MKLLTKVNLNKNIEGSEQFCKFDFDPVPEVIEEHLKLSGWIIGIESPAVGIELIQDGQLVGEAALTIHRPRAAKTYATFPGAEHSGFMVDIPLENINCELGKILIQAVFEDFKRITLASLNLSLSSFHSPQKKTFFVHVPKTAGSSFNKFLKTYLYGQKHCEAYREVNQEFTFNHLDILKSFDFISGHLNLQYFNKNFDRNQYFLVTLLRNPVDQLISHVNWLAYIHQCDHNSAFYQSTPEVIKKMVFNLSKRDLTNSLDVIDFLEENQGLFKNTQSRYFQTNLNLDADTIIENLLNFDLVGLTENYSEFIKRYVSLIELEDHIQPINNQENVNSNPAISKDVLMKDSKFVEFMNNYNVIDVKVYNHFYNLNKIESNDLLSSSRKKDKDKHQDIQLTLTKNVLDQPRIEKDQELQTNNPELAKTQAELNNTQEQLQRLQSQFDEVLAELEQAHWQLHQTEQTQSGKAISTNLEEKMAQENSSAKHNKVFCIGLSKTATTSLTQAMKILGYKTKHYLLNPDVDILEHEFLGDMPIQTRYKEYDKKYPGSKFILTVRDKKSWLRSCMNHFRSPVRNKNSLQYKYRIEQTGIDGYDEDVFSKTYDQHIESIKEYFKQREGDLLILDICGGEGWGQLCAFLGKEIPKQPFPKIHVSKNKSSVVAQAVIKQEPHPVGEIAENRTLEHQELRSEKILLCAIAKNEAAYLVEWVAYHKFIIGFDEVLIYENDSKDNSKLILEKLDKLGICQYKDWPRAKGIVPQRSAYNDAIKTQIQSYKWVCFLDLDEFLVLKNFNSIQDCIQSFEDKADSILINWLVFGSSGYSNYSPEPVTQRFRKCADYSIPIHKHMKSISKIDSIEVLDIHIPRLKPNSRYFHIDGTELHFGTNPTLEHIKGKGHINHKPAQINHYQSKSLEEYKCRKLKGRATVDETSTQSHLKPGDFDHLNSYCNQIENLDIIAGVAQFNHKIDSIYQDLGSQEVYADQFNNFIHSEADRYDSLVKSSTPINKAKMPKISKIPLWAPEAVGKISEFLMERPGAKILEFGSGGSTIWLSNYDVELVSIEHDQSWFSALQLKLEEQSISKVRLVLREKPYFNIADEFPDHHFDLILVDGRDRNECIQAALKKVKNGGLLVLDDAQRTRYRMGRNLLEAFPSARYYHPQRYTQIWSIRHDLNCRSLAVDNPFESQSKTVSPQVVTQDKPGQLKQAVSTGNPRDTENFLYYKKNLINLVDITNTKGLEIGAFDRPFITPNEGNIDYSDYRSTKELKDLAKRSGRHHPKFVVDVTYDLKQTSLREIPQQYDYIIASHVLEHTPNMIGFLNDTAHLLNSNGLVFLIIPDKRYTFDCLKPLTTLGELLENHFDSLDKPRFRQVFNSHYYNRPLQAIDVWSGKVQDSQLLPRIPRNFQELISKALESKESYIDSHCNIFTDVHFKDIISELIQGGLLNFSQAEVHTVKRKFCDFLCILRK